MCFPLSPPSVTAAMSLLPFYVQHYALSMIASASSVLSANTRQEAQTKSFNNEDRRTYSHYLHLFFKNVFSKLSKSIYKFII